MVELYGDQIDAHPVGTGPFKLVQWRRSSFIALERNPEYRAMFYDAEPAAEDVEGQALLKRLKGKRLPIIDRVEISIIEEAQPRWLTFLKGDIDLIDALPAEFIQQAMPGGKVAPNLARQGVQGYRMVRPSAAYTFFNMEHPLVGGYTPEKVALRRAIGLAYDLDREIRILRRGQAVPAQAAMPPGTFGYDPAYKSENSASDPARAKALLDTYGYLDRDGDGWRELPDGSPLVLTMATQASQIERQFNEVWQKSLQAVGLRIKFSTAQWPENLKSARAGKLQMWSLGDTAESPDAQASLEYMYGPSIGSNNLARFRLPAFDALFRRMQLLPDGPERAALFIQASNLVAAYMPYKIHTHRVITDLNHPWITGYRRTPFRNECWQYVEVDPSMRERMVR